MKFARICPICGNDEFLEFNKRANARCATCHSMERTRLLWMYLERLGLLRTGLRVLHFAPEPGLSSRLRELSSGYVSADIDPSQYGGFLPQTVRVDLCAPDLSIVGSDFDLIIHFHVLEHVPCAVGPVLQSLRSLLAPGGAMLFGVPVRAGATTTEDLSAELSGEERQVRFGQHDHMRMFGSEDVHDFLSDVLGGGLTALSSRDYFTERETRLRNVPYDDRITGNTVFLYRDPT